ncbi:MAG: exosome complex component Rrp42, partial [Metallosphaera sp.]
MSMTPTKENVVPLIKKESIISLLERGSRNDGRKFNDYRPLSITLGYAKKADGSALVKLGDTTVLAGVKIEEDEPYSDTPNQGNLVVNAELLPLAYETFEPGPPDENAIELSRVVDRSLRDSKAVDLSAL